MDYIAFPTRNRVRRALLGVQNLWRQCDDNTIPPTPPCRARRRSAATNAVALPALADHDSTRVRDTACRQGRDHQGSDYLWPSRQGRRRKRLNAR